MKKKIEINNILRETFKKKEFRVYKWAKYIKRRKSEDKMVSNFGNKMGTPNDITIVVGDYSDTGLKGKESSITKKIRYLFKQNGYKTLMIDEFRTSCLCSKCGKKMENYEKIWKLLHCEKCKSIHNRDHNATKNMHTIIEKIKKSNSKPVRFRR